MTNSPDYLSASTEVIPDIELESSEPEQSRFKRAYQVAKRAVEGAMVSYEVFPLTNEGSRYGALAATEVMTHNPAIGAAVLGGSTLLIEGAAALASSDLITSDTGKKLMNWLNKKTEKVIPEDAKMSLPVEGAISLYLGTAISTAVKQRENPERSKKEVRRRSLLTAAWVSGVCAVEGAAISEGVGNYTNPTDIAIALAAVGATFAIPKWAKKALNRSKREEAVQTEESYSIRYDLSEEELTELNNELVEQVRTELPGREVAAVWLSPSSKYANFIRMQEAAYFPEVQEVTEEDEKNTLFLAMVDTRPGVERIVHGATVTGVRMNADKQPVSSTESGETTGFYTIDSLSELGNFSAEEFRDYYSKEGIDVSRSISVETNFRIGDKSQPFGGLPMPYLAYLKMFDLVEKTGGTQDNMIIATINRASIISFQRLGIDCRHLMGRDDFKTPEALLGKESLPVCLPSSEQNLQLFQSLREVVDIPEIYK